MNRFRPQRSSTPENRRSVDTLGTVAPFHICPRTTTADLQHKEGSWLMVWDQMGYSGYADLLEEPGQ